MPSGSIAINYKDIKQLYEGIYGKNFDQTFLTEGNKYLYESRGRYQGTEKDLLRKFYELAQ